MQKRYVGRVWHIGEPSKSTEEIDLMGFNAVGRRKPWQALG
jgi:hypothetical protein